MEYSLNSICFEGICRIYRNSCVGHIRSVLRGLYPEDYQERVKAPFKPDEWAKISANASLSRQTGDVEGALTDEIDVLGVNHFYNIFERYFEDLFPSARSLPDDVKREHR